MSIAKRAIRNSTIQGIILASISLCVTSLALELAVRIHRGKVFQFQSSTAESKNRVGRMEYHSMLGWIPKPGRFSSDWTSKVDSFGIRSNGRSIPTEGQPILTVGDSFTFGDEVEDSETWPSHLEEILNKHVLNASVGAYGIDQAFLRAKLLLDKYDPDVVILSFISNDINRTEYSYYPYGRGWKPYFKYKDSTLVLQNVPVPQELSSRKFQTLRHILGYSFLADFVLDRVAPQWWHDFPVTKRIHNDGENVCLALLVRLNQLIKRRGGKFIAIPLATNGRIGDNERLLSLIKRAREKGVEVLDLSADMLKLQPSQFQSLFMPSGHYSPAMNRFVAEHIAAFLRERGIRPPPNKSLTVW
ncbi:MAG: hypothetical protein A2057_16955 [Ignavibacteria bacterium GWA2_35_9]|nr:MAG: hypothetical protein A2057_16955 [Ignavibacteria bacterium GWA2_35_9]OGU44336.1 MAG: hypothetical protein A2000_04425 [Ignavibacteria bacterium GWB2_36_8]OGU50860.1 MAG: hypothetical protein A2080_03855 [Ignavibacteria bacterium GWC2_36_12]